MKKEVTKKVERKETMGADTSKGRDSNTFVVFDFTTRDGFAHIHFIDQKMYVRWLNDEGYGVGEMTDISLDDIERVAAFMSDLKSLRLEDYSKKP